MSVVARWFVAWLELLRRRRSWVVSQVIDGRDDRRASIVLLRSDAWLDHGRCAGRPVRMTIAVNPAGDASGPCQRRRGAAIVMHTLLDRWAKMRYLGVVQTLRKLAARWPDANTRKRVAVLALFSALSCGPADSTATSFGVGPGTMPAGSTTTSGSSGSSDSSTSTGSTSGTSTGPALDTSTGSEPPPDFGHPGPEGCQGKIDFLFVISNSPTMKGHQPQVVAALPDFITSIQAEFANFDTHIMVTDTDAFWQMDQCSVCGPGCDPEGEPPLCGAELDACDTAMGAGVTFPGGSDSSARRCELAAGRYITGDDPDPIAAFLCVAKVGSEGGAPRVADAMVAALSWPLLGTNGYPPGCNQGFLRDDALLVVTLISDVYEEDSSGPAEAWRKALMDAKNQDGEAFQLLVITTDVDVVGGLCGGFTNEINRLRTFVEIVPHGKIGSICAESYGPFFDEAVAEVLKRCESFVPPQ